MHRRSVLVLTLAAAALAADAAVVATSAVPVACAQDAPPAGPQTPPTKRPPETKGSGKDRIKLGDDTGTGQPEAPPATKPAPEAPKAPERTEVDVLMDELTKWPAPEAKQASIRLAAQPSVVFPLLDKKIREPGGDWKTVCGVAATLGKIADARALEPIQAKLQDKQLWLHSGDLLDAIVRIDPAGAKSRLMAQLLHPAGAVVEEAAARLEPRVAPTDVAVLRDVIDAGGPAARAAAVRLLTKADPVEARSSLVARLRDPSPEVALTAARGLAADDSPESLTLLQRSVVSPVDRLLAYATIALALRGERTGTNLFDDVAVKLLLGGRGIAGLEPLNRAAAAIALADIGYFHQVEPVEAVYETRVAGELVEIVAGRSFWTDLKALQPLALRRLQRVSGRTEFSTPQEWGAWWEQAASSFRARRILIDVPDSLVSTFSLSMRGDGVPGGAADVGAGRDEPVTLAAGTDGLAAAAPDDLTLLMTPEQSVALLAAVRQSGVLRAAAVVASSDTVDGLQIVVRSGRRERRVAIAPSARTPDVERLVSSAAALRRELGWQKYRTAGQAVDLPSFVALHGKRFAPDRPQAERDAAFAELVVLSLDDRRDESFLLRGLEELRNLENLSAALGDEGVRRLLSLLGRRKTLDPVAEGAIRALAVTGRTEAHPHLLDFLSSRPSPLAHELLTLIFLHAPKDELVAGLKSETSAVRRGAIASLSEKSPADIAEPAVRAALDHSDADVQREALRALGRLRFEWARENLKTTAGRDGPLRAAAIEALGLLGGRDVLPAIMGGYASNDAALRVVSIRALAATREPEALSAIAFAMSGDPEPLVREVADKAIVSIGSERAAAELRRLALDRAQQSGPRARAVLGLSVIQGREALRDLARLVDDPAEEVGDEAAIALAKWRDAAAAPRLIEMLEKGRSTHAARAALEGLSLELFGQEDPRALANLYAGWWETSRPRGPRGWLVDALVIDNIDDPALRAWESGGSAVAAVPTFLKGLDIDNWAVRRAIDLVFRDLSSRDFGSFERWTSASESERIVAAWKEYWARQMNR